MDVNESDRDYLMPRRTTVCMRSYFLEIQQKCTFTSN